MNKSVADFDKKMGIPPVCTDGIVFHDVAAAPFELTGFAWFAQDHLFRRLPLHPGVPLTEAVDFLANCTAGGKVRFSTDSPRILIRAQRGDFDQSDTMPYLGRAGFDLYEGEPGREKLVSVIRANPEQSLITCNFQGVVSDGKMRTYTLYFPLYKSVSSVEIGLAENITLTAPPPLDGTANSIVVYGTSITQGGCASRPGMCYTNILSRMLKRHLLNFGFSGSGCGEPEVAQLLASIPGVSLFLLDFEPNTGGVYDVKLPPFIAELRKKYPVAPIIVLTRYHFSWLPVNPVLLERNRQAVISLNDPNIHFIDGSDILGEDGLECLVDGTHASDMAFYRMAKALAPVIGKLL